MRIIVLGLLAVFLGTDTAGQTARVSSALTIGRLKYGGGGDWYNDPSAEVNLLRFAGREAGLDVNPRYAFVEIGNENLFSYPILFLTGHGNITLTETETRRLRTYLENGGFLYVDDDYGLEKAVRREMRRVFPGQEFVELPFDHGIYHCHFSFPSGPPKTHEHDGKAPSGLGLFHNGRLAVFFTVESNPSDGWADPEIHNDPEPKRQEALRFGTNILVWALTH